MATTAAPLLDAETFSAASERDALGRVLKAITRTPEGAQPVDTPLDPGLPEAVSQAYLEVGVRFLA